MSYFDQQRKSYSRVKNFFVQELIGDLRGKRFLDYGCGAGLFVVHAAKNGAREIIGVDAEASILSTATCFMNREGVTNRCKLILSEYFPAFDPDTVFDIILLKDVIEHVEDDGHLLTMAGEKTTSGGILVISTQNAFSLNYLTEGVYHRYLRGEKDWYGWDETHVRFYTFMELTRKLRHAGWRPVAWRSNYIIPHKSPLRPVPGRKIRRFEWLSHVDMTLGGRFPWNRCGWNLILKAVKI